MLLVILIVTFSIIRVLPGDPARLQMGPLAPEAGVQKLREEMKLDRPLPEQFIEYVKHVLKGDFGRSWVTQNTVKQDLKRKLPVTLELVLLGVFTMVIVFIPLGCITASKKGGLVTRTLKKIASIYGLLAGSFPDFWLGLMLIFVFFTKLKWLPGPEGILGILTTPPSHITGMYLFDSIVTRNFTTLKEALLHYILPVFTLSFVYGAIIYKYTWSGMSKALRDDYTLYAEALGLPKWKVFFYAFRNALPPVVIMTANQISYLLGGAVLIESVFNIDGIGQYAVQSIVSSDYPPIQAFVLIAATFTMLSYLLGDIINFLADPRIRIRGRNE